MASVAFLFAANYIVSKITMASFSPLSFAYVRVLGAAIVLNVFLRERGNPPLERDDVRRLIGFAILGVVLNQSLFLAGLAFTSAHVAAILITAIPVFALVAALFMRLERPTPAKIGGIALAFAGALVVLGREGLEGTGKSLLGDFFILGNSLAYALYLVLSKPVMARLSARRVTSWMFGIGAVAMLPIAAVPLWRQNWSAIPTRAWLAVALVVAGPTVAAYLLNAWALRYVDSSIVAAYTYLQPVGVAILAAIFLGERISVAAIVAGLMIIAGVSLSSSRR